MNILKKRVNLPGKKFDAVPISAEEITKGLEAGTIRQLAPEVFEEVDGLEYQTKVMTPGKTRGRPKGSKNKKKQATGKRGRPRKAAL